MRYKYPKINDWLVFTKLESGQYLVEDYLDDKTPYLFSSRKGYFARHLDGSTDPFSIFEHSTDREVVALLRELDESSLLRRSRFIRVPGGVCYTLWTPKVGNRRPVAIILNLLLRILFLPVFIVGLCFFIKMRPHLSDGMIYTACVIGTIASMILHELAHMIACLANDGGLVFELGLLLRIPLPGAYVMMDTTSITGTLNRVHISAAGIEANLLLSGIMLLLATIPSGYTSEFFCVAIVNIELALLNLLLIGNLDGAQIIADLLGVESLKDAYRNCWRSLIHGHRNRDIRKPDMVYSTMCFFAALVQPVSIVLVILDVVGIIRGLWG